MTRMPVLDNNIHAPFGHQNTLLFLQTVILIFSAYFAARIVKYLRIVYFTLGRDLRALYKFLRTKYFLYLLGKRNATVPIVFKETVARHPNKVAFYFNDESWTFKELDEYSNKVANAFIEMGYKPGDEVALFMESRPDFVGIWLGLAKAGIVSALVNTNQRLNVLVHSITTVNSKALIFGTELQKAVKDAIPLLEREHGKIEYFRYGDIDQCLNSSNIKDLKSIIDESQSDDPFTIEHGKFTDKLFYIYTSGTTGLPKAAIIRHCRFMFFGTAIHNLGGLTDDETIYTTIPLYHVAGGCLGISQCLVFGCSIAIRTKFSASNFWADCIKYNCTAAQYVGELCRYLLAQPPKPTDNQHQVKIVFGNGLRPGIWREFKSRFNIDRIGEFYGATEGNSNVVNIDNKEGSCGFISRAFPTPLVRFFYPVNLIRVNEETGEPLRDKNGFCISCGPGEVGEFVGKITEGDPIRAFDGYVNKNATDKKIIRNVYKKGDAAFASGDLLTMDELGYLYFKDRTGDTFRWKGENVSTLEVESVISNLVNQQDSIVFGVEIPGCEGRAGMSAILDPDCVINPNELLKSMQAILPLYALPVFLRFTVNPLEATGTFKLPKMALQKDGYNINMTDQDPIYYLNLKKREYVRLTKNLYEDILNGQITF